MQMCKEIYNKAKNTIFIIFKILCNNKKNLKPLVTPKLTKNKIKEITFNFKNLNGIPYIFAINGNHFKLLHIR